MMDLMDLHIAVLCGGTSSEREVSLKSGQGVFEALKARGLRVTLIDAQDDFLGRLKNESVNFVFIALHGKFGEDGTVQTLLEKAGIPYAGSGPEACQKAMDKDLAQTLFWQAGLKVPAWRVYHSYRDAIGHVGMYPVFVKPVSGGSSIGVNFVRGPEDLPLAVKDAFHEDERIMIQHYTPGREMAVGILGEEALPVLEILPSQNFYDFEAKYESSQTRYLFPQDLSEDKLNEIQDTALKAHRVLGLEGFSRVDVIVTPDETFILEVNAIPGLTPKSLLPKQAQARGITFEDLCVMIIQESLPVVEEEHGTT